MWKVILFFSILGSSLGFPTRPRRQAPFGSDAVILRDDREGPTNGFYSFRYETSDGVVRQEEGTPTGPEGTVVQRGSWSFVFPDGTVAEFSFVADENGYRVESPLLPVGPPPPPHSVAQREFAEAQRGNIQSLGENIRGFQPNFNENFQTSFQSIPRRRNFRS